MSYKDAPFIIVAGILLTMGLWLMVTEEPQPENHWDNYPLTGLKIYEARK